MILLSNRAIEREAAQTGPCAIAGLAQSHRCGSVGHVVAARDERAGTTCLYRYPSPVGRCGSQMSHPPSFLRNLHKISVYKQWLAEVCPSISNVLCDAENGPRVPSVERSEQKGILSCTHTDGFWASRPVRALRPAATRLANRRCSVRAPARLARPCWTAMSQPARLSVRRPMSPIATNTRHAATERDAPACGSDMNRNPISAFGRGGFFVAIALRTVAGPRPEGTRNVQ